MVLVVLEVHQSADALVDILGDRMGSLCHLMKAAVVRRVMGGLSLLSGMLLCDVLVQRRRICEPLDRRRRRRRRATILEWMQ